jgi:hypothetical protein
MMETGLRLWEGVERRLELSPDTKSIALPMLRRDFRIERIVFQS